MVKRKKKKTFTINADIEVLFTAREWALQEGLDPVLFEKWRNKLMTKEEFNKLKKEVM